MFYTKQKATQINPIIDFNNLTDNTIEVNTPETYFQTIEFNELFTGIADSGKHRDLMRNTKDHILTAYDALEPYKNVNKTTLYTEFHIPKHSGGLRTINAPIENFKYALSLVLQAFKQIPCHPHEAAYAYIEQRSVKDAVAKHQANQSNWFLKLDIKHFFPSCTPEFVYQTLLQLHPYALLDDMTKEKLKTVIETCSLNNGLPQGSPVSPLLTNLIMIPFDYRLTKALKENFNKHFVYTRYADDLLISSKSNFKEDIQKIKETIGQLLQPTFELKTEKTRYGSKAGSNWNLGLMLNKDNNITLGAKVKKDISAMLNNFLINSANWTKNECQILKGKLNYLQQIEPAYYQVLITRYKNKYGGNPEQILQNKLK